MLGRSTESKGFETWPSQLLKWLKTETQSLGGSDSLGWCPQGSFKEDIWVIFKWFIAERIIQSVKKSPAHSQKAKPTCFKNTCSQKCSDDWNFSRKHIQVSTSYSHFRSFSKYFRFRSKPIPKACNFYGQIMFTSIYVYTELGQKYGPFGDFDDPDREYENFSVGGQYCRLQYLSGKTERNEREQWITQLGKLPGLWWGQIRVKLESDGVIFNRTRAQNGHHW